MNKKLVIILVSIFLILTLVNLFFIRQYIVAQHESVHQEIYSQYGIESEVHINYFDGLFSDTLGYTKVDASEYESKCNDSCKLANHFNEVVGYNILGLEVTIVVIFFLYSIFNIILVSILISSSNNKSWKGGEM